MDSADFSEDESVVEDEYIEDDYYDEGDYYEEEEDNLEGKRMNALTPSSVARKTLTLLALLPTMKNLLSAQVMMSQVTSSNVL